MSGAASSAVYRQALSIVQQRLLDARQLHSEYKNVVMRDRAIEHTIEQSQRPENGPRNRYVNVLPYDYNRIKLSGLPGYINASSVTYVNADNELRCNYIAAQGPVSGTVEEFWRMCLEQECTAVVMLTNLVERGVTKCAAYFPAKVGEVLSTPKVEVRTLDVQTMAQNTLTIRDMQLKGCVGMQNRTLMLKHYHYHAWPDHGAPEESYPIRRMCDALLPHRQNGNSIVVHCSAGIGRTGTFIVIDLVRLQLQKLCALAEHTGAPVDAAAIQQALDIHELVHQLRRQRMGMVQTVDQYVFIYHALKEELTELVARSEGPV